MRHIGTLFTGLILIGFIYFLNSKWGATPPLGKLLSPTHGYLQDPEIIDDYQKSVSLSLPELRLRFMCILMTGWYHTHLC
jgi:hypothetical protein